MWLKSYVTKYTFVPEITSDTYQYLSFLWSLEDVFTSLRLCLHIWDCRHKAFEYHFSYACLETGRIMWLGMAGGGHPHRFPHNNFSSVYRIFTKLGHLILLWKGKNPIYFGVIRSKVKVTITINRIFDNRVVSTW